MLSSSEEESEDHNERQELHQKVHKAGASSESKSKHQNTLASVSTGRVTLYELICRYFLATVSPPLKQARTTVHVDAAECEACFRTGGLRILKRGWARILPIPEMDGIPVNLDYTQQQVRIDSVYWEHKTSEAPANITEPEVLALMESHGIGTDATMQQHIATLGERGYVDTVVKKADNGQRWNKYRRELWLTRFGKSVLHALTLLDKDLVLPSVRAAVEKDYKAVAAGREKASDIVSKRMVQYKARFESMFQSLWRDQLLIEFLTAGNGKQRDPYVAKKQQTARKIISQAFASHNSREVDSTYTEHDAFTWGHTSMLPKEHAGFESIGTDCWFTAEAGDCISSDAIVWQIVESGAERLVNRVPLHSVEAGSCLLAVDESSQELVSDAEVGCLFLIPARNCVKLELSDDSVMVCTGDHPVTCVACRLLPPGGAIQVVTNQMYSKPASALRRGEDSVCILASGVWIALSLRHDPCVPEELETPSHLVHLTMVHENHKPFVALPDYTNSDNSGIALGSSPESTASDTSQASDFTSSASTPSDGSNIIMLGLIETPRQLSYQTFNQLTADHPSAGSRDHDANRPQTCSLCWPNHNGTCHLGVLCNLCHHTHPELPRRFRTRNTRGSRRHN